MNRKITRQSIAAFLAGKRFNKANMSVELAAYNGTDQPKEIVLKLHGNTIARRDVITGKIEITTAGWSTPTTKSRLNGLPGVQVFTRNFDLFLNGKPWDGAWITV